METMEYSRVRIKDIFGGFADFFKEQVNRENEDIERQIAEIKKSENTARISEIEKMIIPNAKTKREKAQRQVIKTKTVNLEKEEKMQTYKKQEEELEK